MALPVMQRSISGEAILKGVSANAKHKVQEVDAAIRKQVVLKLAKARSFSHDDQLHLAELEESKMHGLVIEMHRFSSIAPWELALQYERCMEKHIDLIICHKFRSLAPTPAQMASKRVLREYKKYIHFGLTSPVVPEPCKRVLQDITKVLEKNDLTVTGVRRVENSLKLLKVKIDQRCEELNACSALVKSKTSKRKAIATPRGGTPRDSDAPTLQNLTIASPINPPQSDTVNSILTRVERQSPVVRSNPDTQDAPTPSHPPTPALLAQIQAFHRKKGREVKRIRRQPPPPLTIRTDKQTDSSTSSDHSSLTPTVAALSLALSHSSSVSSSSSTNSSTDTPTQLPRRLVSQLQSEEKSGPQSPSQEAVNTSPSQNLVKQQPRFVPDSLGAGKVRKAFRKLTMADCTLARENSGQEYAVASDKNKENLTTSHVVPVPVPVPVVAALRP